MDTQNHTSGRRSVAASGQKSRRGIATLKAELDLIEQRLKRAKADYKRWSRSGKADPARRSGPRSR
jgi:hypothetical protein